MTSVRLTLHCSLVSFLFVCLCVGFLFLLTFLSLSPYFCGFIDSICTWYYSKVAYRDNNFELFSVGKSPWEKKPQSQSDRTILFISLSFFQISIKTFVTVCFHICCYNCLLWSSNGERGLPIAGGPQSILIRASHTCISSLIHIIQPGWSWWYFFSSCLQKTENEEDQHHHQLDSL